MKSIKTMAKMLKLTILVQLNSKADEKDQELVDLINN